MVDPTSWSDHPYLRWHTWHSALALARWQDDDVVVLLLPGYAEGSSMVHALGDAGAAGHLLSQVLLAPECATTDRISAPRGWVEALRGDAAERVGAGGDWDWFWTPSAPPRQPAEAEVVRLTDHAEVAELLDASSPRASARPGDAGIERWVGVRRAGRLVAVAANQPARPDVPHLASVATRPGHRGQGLGGTVSAALTRDLLAEGAPVVTLGMYADNDAARSVYGRLGFRCGAAFSSRALRVL